jgi:hypothetical protein
MLTYAMLTDADVCFRIQVDEAVEARIRERLLTLTYADVCFRIQVDQAVEARIIDGLLTREADILLLAKHYAKALPERFMQVRIIPGTKVLKLVVLNYLLAKHYAKTLSERFMQVRIICGTELLKLVVLKYFQTLCQSAARALHAGEDYLWY